MQKWEDEAGPSPSSSPSGAPGPVPASQQDLKHVDPYGLVHAEVAAIGERLRHSVVSSIPALKNAAEYYFKPGVEGKRLRPTMLMLMSSALQQHPSTASSSLAAGSSTSAAAAAQPSTSDAASSRAGSAATPGTMMAAGGVPEDCLTMDLRPPGEYVAEPRRRHQRIAEIAELIHVASLLHDDVLDDASSRRGVLSLNVTVGNKVAILAGDFLLARASVSLASLRDTTIVELLSQVLEHLVSGEVMQMTSSPSQLLDIDHYLHKTFCKTASLMANSARAQAILAGQPPEVCDLAWQYGRHLGLSFQVIDDILDLTGSASVLGKPALNDLKSGIATAPVLFAAEEFPELQPLIHRRFKRDGDVASAMALIKRSSGIARAKELAVQHAQLAERSIQHLPPATSLHSALCRQALIKITHKVLTRSS